MYPLTCKAAGPLKNNACIRKSLKGKYEIYAYVLYFIVLFLLVLYGSTPISPNRLIQCYIDLLGEISMAVQYANFTSHADIVD